MVIKDILAVIPAKTASTRIRNKNFAPVVDDVCLLTIAHAFATHYFDNVIVTTDNALAARVLLNRLGRTVPMFEGKAHASDNSMAVWREAWDHYDPKKEFSQSVLLEPTSPMRTINDIHKCVESAKTLSGGWGTVNEVKTTEGLRLQWNGACYYNERGGPSSISAFRHIITDIKLNIDLPVQFDLFRAFYQFTIDRSPKEALESLLDLEF